MTLYGEKKETKSCVLRVPKPWQDMQEDSHTDIGRFSGPDHKRNDTELTRTSRMGEWDHVAEDMMINFSESGHLVFRRSRAFERGSLRSKGGGQVSFHFCGDDNTAELYLRTIIFVNQLSVYGAVPEMCDELALENLWFFRKYRETCAQNNSETMLVPTELSTTTKPLLTNETVQGNLVREYERKFAHLPDDIVLIRCAPMQVSQKTADEGQYL